MNITPTRIITTLLILAAIFMASCQSAPVRADDSAPIDPKQQMLDEKFAKVYLNCVGVRVSPTRGGPLQAQVDIANNRLSHRNFAYKFDWYDASGNLIPSQLSVWKPLTLPSKETKTLISIAPSPDAMDFDITIRKSK